MRKEDACGSDRGCESPLKTGQHRNINNAQYTKGAKNPEKLHATASIEKAVGHYLKISAADHKDWWATRWYLPAGEQKPNDSVPNFKIMNDAAIALADKECRSEFVSLCVRNIEEMVERVLAIPE